MGYENPSDISNTKSAEKQEKPELSGKEKKLEQIRQGVEMTGDALGKGIDEEIKETVIMCKALEMPTSSSCEGHVDKNGLRVPYIEITADKEPERWNGVNRALEEIRPLKESDNEKYHQEYWKIMREYSQKEETPEYKKWEEENEKLKEKARVKIEEFYKDRKVEPSTKLQIDEMVGGFRIYSGGEDYKPVIEEDEGRQFSVQEKINFYKKLEKYQDEMREFANFLKDKFLEKDVEKEREVEYLETDKGSVYKYLPDGRTQRFKMVENKRYEPQSAIVFIPDWK